jgi:HSP20 family protein
MMNIHRSLNFINPNRRFITMRFVQYSYPASTDFDQFLGALFPTAGRCNSGACDTSATATARTEVPATELAEDAESYHVKVELPGVKKEDIQVDIEKSVLTLTAKRATKTAGGETTAEYRRVLSLPEGVDAAKVTATYENGLLTLTVPKAEQAKPRRIEVR